MLFQDVNKGSVNALFYRENDPLAIAARPFFDM